MTGPLFRAQSGEVYMVDCYGPLRLSEWMITSLLAIYTRDRIADRKADLTDAFLTAKQQRKDAKR